MVFLLRDAGEGDMAMRTTRGVGMRRKYIRRRMDRVDDGGKEDRVTIELRQDATVDALAGGGHSQGGPSVQSGRQASHSAPSK